MGNTASNASGLDSPSKTDTSDADKSPKRRSPKRAGKLPSSANRTSALSKEMVDALKQQGYCVPESKMGDLLRMHDSPVAAVTDAIDSGVARKLVKGRDPRSSNNSSSTEKKTPQENVRPPLPPGGSSSTSSRKITQKRSRTAAEGESTEMSSAVVPATTGPARGERPLKRPATMRGFASITGGGGFGGFGNGGKGRSGGDDEVSTKPADRPFDCKGAGGGGEIGNNESTESEERRDSTAMTVDADSQHVLLPMQQGSPPRHRLGRSRGVVAVKGSEKKPSRAVTADGPRGRTFVTVKAELTAKKIEDIIMAGLMRWEEKSEEQKEENARLVIKDLRLTPLGPERRERMDEDLTRCIAAAMEDLGETPNVRDGAQVISLTVHDTRNTIHDVYAKVVEEYEDLVNKHKNQHERTRTNHNSTNNNSRSGTAGDNIRNDEERLARRGSPLPSCDRSYGSPSPALQRSNRLDQRSPVPPRRLHKPQPATANTPPENGFSSLAFGLGGGGGASPFWGSSRGSDGDSGSIFSSGSSRSGGGGGGGGGGRTTRAESSPSPSGGGRSTAEQQPMSDEERNFWQSLDLCYTALKNAAFVREEHEWLQRQLEVVGQEKEQVEDENATQLGEHEGNVETAEETAKETERKVEAATQAIVAEHVGAQTKDQALRSLIDCVQTGCGRFEGYELLVNRGRDKLAEEAAKAMLKSCRTRLVHVKHATAISSVLCDHMFGDLLETAEDMLKKAQERRLSKQQLLKSNAKAVLEHLTKAMGYHITRRMSAEEDVRQSAEKFEHNAKFFGEESTKAQKSKATLDEMQAYVTDSIRKTDDIVEEIRLLVAKLGPELSQEDCYTLTKDARQRFAKHRAQVNQDAEGRNIDIAGPLMMLNTAEAAFSPTSSRKDDP